MGNKISSSIEKAELNTATFNGITITPTLINFFFGRNGAGKSTIARSIAADEGITWQQGKTSNDYSVLVYNQEFISTNIQNYENLPGVFTISKRNIEIQNLIEEKLQQKKAQDEQFTKLSTAKSQKEAEQSTLLGNFQEKCWSKTKPIRSFFDQTQASRKQKATFAAGVLGVTSPIEHDKVALKTLYETAFDPNAKSYREFQSVKNDVVVGLELLGKPIVSSNDTPFASFIKALNATDWVRHGHEQFSNHQDGKCPYCQQILPPDFEYQLSSCFDAQYQQDIEEIKQFKATYKTTATELWNTLKSNLNDVYPKLDLTKYKDKLALFESTVKLNLQKIEDKIQSPSSIVELEDVATLLGEINGIIIASNLLIKQNNDVVSAKQQKQAECKRKVWEYIAYTLKDDVASYKTSTQNLNTNITSLTTQITTSYRASRTLTNEIAELNRQVVNTKAAVDSINALLHDSGFQGFSLREKSDAPNVYEVIRSNGTIAKNLSEGERNFIGFLYFYHLVRGSHTDDGSTKDKVVVIDDPVSSMDSSALFIVSALVREMIEICHNNVNYEETLVAGSYIKQIFILTHNAYFHREVTYNQVNRYQFVSFFVINKVENISTVKLCQRQNPNIPTEKENYNPVQNAYAALWCEYNEVKTAIPTLNVIRRILEYYFLQLCGYDGTDLRNTILKEHRPKFVITLDDGQEDYTQYHLASAMLSYLDTNSNSISDGLNYIDDCLDVNQCKSTFEMIFELMNQGQHYKMMMGIN